MQYFQSFLITIWAQLLHAQWIPQGQINNNNNNNNDNYNNYPDYYVTYEILPGDYSNIIYPDYGNANINQQTPSPWNPNDNQFPTWAPASTQSSWNGWGSNTKWNNLQTTPYPFFPAPQTVNPFVNPLFPPVNPGFPTQNTGQCGRPAIQPNLRGKRDASNPITRIMYGSTAIAGSWPWQVGLSENQYIAHCGATLIGPNTIVTAAHCVYDEADRRIPARRLCVTVGIQNLEQQSSTAPCYQISRVVVHPQFNTFTVDNDIAVLFTTQTIPYSNTVQPACLPSSPANQASNCYATGWGMTETGQTSEPLKQAKLQIKTPQECQQKHQMGYNTQTMICALGANLQDTCQGDSGGPLVCQSAQGAWELQGVVSFGGDKCSDRSFPGVYTNVYQKTAWIRSVTGSNG